MQDIRLTPIGILHTPYTDIHDMPVQSAGCRTRSIIRLNPELIAGLQGVESFSHLILITYLHRAEEERLVESPMVDGGEPHGIFATRHMCRPNRIGFSVVRLLSVRENNLFVEGADFLNETPVLDIKPYIPAFDSVPSASSGWLSSAHIENIIRKNSWL